MFVAVTTSIHRIGAPMFLLKAMLLAPHLMLYIIHRKAQITCVLACEIGSFGTKSKSVLMACVLML